MKLAQKPIYEIGNSRAAGSAITAASTARGIEFVISQHPNFLHGALLSSVGLVPVEIMLAGKAKPVMRTPRVSLWSDGMLKRAG
ncbi:hypothetical protein ACVW1C_000946 [Bradyrhizobium sp. USDA 4011]